jgi:predicted acyltransferase
MTELRSTSPRIASLDQFRGYTVAGMFLVNFLGSYAATPLLLKHHNTFCSYADTIMPQFFFAVGFAFRLTFGRRAQTDGLTSAYWHMVKRMLGLALVALVVYNVKPVAGSWNQLVEKGFWEVVRGPAKGAWFQTLMHIAVTSLWVLPVIRSSAGVRIGYMIFSALLQVGLSYWFYFDFVNHGAIDGGPLGFLAWSIPTIVGTLACDAVTAPDGPRVAKMFVWSVVLMGLGYLLSCPTTLYTALDVEVESQKNDRFPPDPVLPSRERLETHPLSWAEPPFVPPPDKAHRKENYWMMSQRAATVSYHVFGAGFSLAVYALFYVVSDIWGWQLGLFRTLGTNALIGYILHGMVGEAVSAFVPKDSPGWYVTCAFLLYFGITYLFIRHLEKNKIYLKL